MSAVIAMGAASDYNEFKRRLKRFPNVDIRKQFSENGNYIYERHYFDGRFVNGCILTKNNVFVGRLVP